MNAGAGEKRCPMSMKNYTREVKQVKYRAVVPATCANIGVGFDSTGLAVELHNAVEFEAIDSGLIIEAENKTFNVPKDKSNLIYRSAAACAKHIGKELPGLHMKQIDHIPHTRGLGSSSACIIAGLLIATALLEEKLSKQELLMIATEIEGHPDNVAPAIYGGVCISVMEGDRLVSHPIPVKDDICVAAIVPDFTLSTKKAREVLPKNVSMADAISNTARCGLLVSALYSGDYSLIDAALADRLHQPYRKTLIKGYDEVREAAKAAGAYGSCISGAGPTMLAFFSNSDPELESKFAQNLKGIPGGWKPKVMNFDRKGAYLETL